MLTFENLFHSYLYYIPVNQRGYSWNEQQIEDIFSDLNLLNYNVNNKHQDVSKHYFGPVIIRSFSNPHDKDGRTQSACSLDDGQQRITTFYILIDIIFRRLEELKKTSNDADRKSDINRICTDLEKLLFWHDLSKGKTRRLVNDNHDLNHYFNQLLDGNNVIINSSPKKQLKKTYNWAIDRYSNFDFDKIKKDLNDLLHNSLFIRLDLADKKVDRYLTFDAINSRGLPLTQFDKIKNYCMLIYERCNCTANIKPDEEWYSSISILDNFGVGDRTNENIFINDLLSVFLFRKIQIEKTHERFVDTFKDLLSHCDENEFLLNKLNEFINLWAIYAQAFGVISTKNSSKRSGDSKITPICDDWLTKRDNMQFEGTTRIILTTAYIRLNKLELEMLAEISEKFMFRVYAFGNRKDTNDLNFIKLSSWLLFNSSFGLKQLKKAFCELLPLQSPIKTCIDSYLHDRPVYPWSKRYKGWNKILYFLYEYEIELQPIKKTLAYKVGDAFGKKSIEHILPQTFFKYSSGKSVKYWSKKWNESEGELNMHRLGNLVMTKVGSNAILSNLPFPEKLNGPQPHFYNKSDAFNAEKEIHKYADKNGDWTKCSIDDREVELINFFKKRWVLECEVNSFSVENESIFDDEGRLSKPFANNPNKLNENANEEVINEEEYDDSLDYFLKVISNLRRDPKSLYSKPLLLLFLINKISDSKNNQFFYSAIKDDLGSFFTNFNLEGVSKSTRRTSYPFCYLEPELWNVSTSRDKLKDPSNPTKEELNGAMGSLNDEFYKLILDDISCKIIVEQLLDYFDDYQKEKLLKLLQLN
jgi:hypothetical protein